MEFTIMASPNPNFQNLSTQESLFNLVKPLDGIEFDEYMMKNAITDGNPNQQIANMNKASSPSSSSASSSSAAASFNLIQTINRKTVDQAWKDIVQQDQSNVGGGGSVQKQEITLEEFLVRTGAINKMNQTVNPQSLDYDPIASQQADWLQFQIDAVHKQQQQQQMEALGLNLPDSASLFGNTVVDIGYSDNQIAGTVSMPMPPMQMVASDEKAADARNRPFSDEIMEKTIERRQKRMIKNRESAARSRARKQAYTNQLEQEVSELKKINKRLKNQKVFSELEISYVNGNSPKSSSANVRRGDTSYVVDFSYSQSSAFTSPRSIWVVDSQQT